MKYSATLKLLGVAYSSMTKEKSITKTEMKEIKREYKDIMVRAKDIGSDNTLLTSYSLAAWFIAMNRKDSLNPEKNISILEQGLKESKLVKMFLGDSKGYFSDKKMAWRREWSKKTHEKKYENDWVVDVLEKSSDYEFGLDYTECGVCKLCNDEGCPQFAKYLCSLDYMLVELIGIKLKRTKTLAEGYDKCDFRFFS